jgi:hypothetical protein
VEGGEDDDQHAFGVGEDVVVPEADDAIAAGFEPGGADVVSRFRSGVLAAVDLDDQLRLRTEEIDDLAADRLLAAEAPAMELLAAQTRPEAELGVGGGLPEAAGAVGGHRARVSGIGAGGYPPPLPPPQGGRGFFLSVA